MANKVREKSEGDCFPKGNIEKKHIDLDPNRMENSSGRKADSKLMLSSCGRKFGQRDNMTKQNLSTVQKSSTKCVDQR